ncbi:MAG TPA: ABC transporter permease [Ruminiclostridium sp.]|nr:ABC transporter permease [Ruminiclostridium sp.]
MLGKLLKYEVRDTSGIIPLFYLITAVLSVLSLFAGKLELGWFKTTSSVLLLLAAIAVVIVTMVILIIRFYKNLYSNEGYLSFTLPLKPHLHLISKTIAAFVWMVLSLLVCLGAIFVSLKGFGVDREVWSSAIEEVQRYGMEKYIFAFIPIICFSILYLLAQMFFSITLANRPAFHNMNAAGASILLFLATYVGLKIVESILSIIIPFSLSIKVVGDFGISFTSKNMVAYLMQSINNPNPPNVIVGLGGSIFQVIMVCVLFYMTGRMMDKKVSLR